MQNFPPPSTEEGTRFWSTLADWIEQEARPGVIFIAGKHAQPQVEALRQKGLDAWGLSPEEILAGPLPRRYDLVIWADECHEIQDGDRQKIIENLCRAGDRVLVAPALEGLFTESPGLPLSSGWLEGFARFGFLFDPDAGLTDSFPGGLLLRKVERPSEQLLAYYEQQLWCLQQEAQARRALGIEQLKELASKEFHNTKLLGMLSERDDKIELQRRQLVEKEFTIQEILNSRSWRLMKRFQSVRLFFIPHDGRIEKSILSVYRGVRILLLNGPKAFASRFCEKGSLRARMLLVRFRYRRKVTSKVILMDPIEAPPPVQPHQASVDIVVCVHNALEEVRTCLDSVVRCTSSPYTLILIDDGSDLPAKEYLEGFAREHGAALLRSDRATGYTLAANRGLAASTGDYVILLNSDTIVTLEWVDRMLTCAEQNPRVGMVGPLSNTASWQSIPEIEHHGDWAPNPLPAGVTIEKMGQLVARYSARTYPSMPFLNGFCLLIRRQLLDEVGCFDEENFGVGYGEENDYALRVREAGWRLALADDAYVYHAQGRSYTDERRKALSDRAGVALAKKHGQEIIDKGVAYCLQDRVLAGIRAHSRVLHERRRLIEKGARFAGKRIIFVLPIPVPTGGGNAVMSQARIMREMGVDVRILNLKGHKETFEKGYPDKDIPVIYTEIDDIPHVIKSYDAAIATFNPSVAWMAPALQGGGGPILGYYIQDFEPYFYDAGSEGYHHAFESYTLVPDLVRFAPAVWTAEEVRRQTGADCAVVGGGYDYELMWPRPRSGPEWPDRPLRIGAMIRPSSHYRSPRLTMEVLQQASHRYGAGIEIRLFGVRPDDPGFTALPHNFEWSLAGILSQKQVARFINETDIFVDFSVYQALGITGMEAMACGNAVILPVTGGSRTFAKDGENALLIDTSSAGSCYQALQRLIEDHELRTRLQRQAVLDISSFYTEIPAYNILNLLFNRRAGSS